MFKKKNPYILSKIWAMHDSCSICGQHYQLEPSFFYGAMYVNYGITVGIAVSVFGAMHLVGVEWEFMHYIIAIIGAIILAAPITFRLGRMVWINIFVGYKPEFKSIQDDEYRKSH